MLTLQSISSLVGDDLQALKSDLLVIFQDKRSPRLVETIYQPFFREKTIFFHGMLVFLVGHHSRLNGSQESPPALIQLAKAAELLAMSRHLYRRNRQTLLTTQPKELTEDTVFFDDLVLSDACANYLSMQSFYVASDFSSSVIARSFSEVQKYFFEVLLHRPINDSENLEGLETQHLAHLYCRSGCFLEKICESAAKLCGNAEYLQIAFARYGRHLGLASELLAQLTYYEHKKSDLLDAMQVHCWDPVDTLPFSLAIKAGTDEEKMILQSFLVESPSTQMQRLHIIHKILEETQSIAGCRQIIYYELQQAEEALQPLPNNSWKSMLVALLNGLRQLL